MKLPKKFVINFRGRRIIVKNYSVCDNVFSKARGLMFRSENYKKPLLFIFDKTAIYPIHSFFCQKFIGVWMTFNGKKIKIIDVKLVNPWKISVTPKEKFDLLLEIPLKFL